MTKKLRLATISAIALMAVAAIYASVFMFALADTSTSERFGYSGVKYRVAQVAPSNANFNDTRSSLLLYAYDDGATANVKGAFSGVFEAEVKAVSENNKPELLAYSFIITDITSGENFKITVEDTGTETNTYITVGEEKFGVYYNVDDTWDGKAHGYTYLQNANGAYTRTVKSGTTVVRFDAANMTVSVKNNAGDYVMVWDMRQPEIDGKRTPETFAPMDLYKVDVEFTQVKTGEKGMLAVYSINGEDYGAVKMPPPAPVLSVNSYMHAVAGKEYYIPEPSVYDFDGKISVTDVDYTVYAGDGEKVTNGKWSKSASFTPESGNYYLYYEAANAKGGKGEVFVKVKSYAEENAEVRFENTGLRAQTVGKNTTLILPAVRAVGNLFEGEAAPYADIEIRKDGNVIERFESPRASQAYAFSATGTYTVRIYAELYGKMFAAEDVTVTVSDDVAGVQKQPLLDKCRVGADITVPEAVIYWGGQEQIATVKIIAPDGETIRERTFTAEKAGEYTVVYTYTANGEEQSFSENIRAEFETTDLFTAEGKSDLRYDDEKAHTDFCGALAGFSDNSGKIIYNKTLDLSDNTKNDTLFEMFMIPSAPGVHDATGFYITLTDKLDRNNFLSIRVVEGSGNASNLSYIRAKANGQSAYTGWYKENQWTSAPYPWVDVLENAMNHNAGGFLSRLNFGANILSNDIQKSTLKLYYDNEEKALYAEGFYDLEHKDGLREKLVVDFDDPACFSNLWNGFTNPSQVELSVSAFGVANRAEIKILNIDGVPFATQTVNDVFGPKVTVDTEGMTEIPPAKVGVPYKIFGITAVDDFCGDETLSSKVRVYYGNEEINVYDGAFTPNTVGRYSIRYYVSDGYGNMTQKFIEVEAREDITAVQIALNGEWPVELKYGYPVEFPSARASGGSGRYVYETIIENADGSVTFNGNEYIPLGTGKYEITIRATDYLGQTASVSKEYSVDFNCEIIFDEESLSLPPAFINGNPFVFDEYKAHYYERAGAEKTELTAQIEITDGSGNVTVGSNRKYTPNLSEAVTSAEVRLTFTANVNGNVVTKSVVRNADILDIPAASGFMTKYFITENAATSAKNRYITFEAETASEMSATFIRSVCADEFAIQFSAYSQGGAFSSEFERLRITLTDKFNPAIAVNLYIIKSGNGVVFSVNSNTPVPMYGSFTEASTQNLAVFYDNSDFSLSGVESSALGKIAETVYGNKFEGFTSHEVYVTFALENVRGNAAVNLVQINNQTMFNAARDTADPQIYVDGSYSGRFVSGTVVTLPVARAYDVLNYTTPATLTVRDGFGNCISAQDGTLLDGVPANREYTVKLADIGRYTVTYVSQDMAGAVREVFRDIVIYDDVLPKIEFASPPAAKVWAGSDVAIPAYTVTDNGDVSRVRVNVYYSDPNGLMFDAENGVVPTKTEGKYTVYFYLIDENENYNVVTYSFIAVARK